MESTQIESVVESTQTTTVRKINPAGTVFTVNHATPLWKHLLWAAVTIAFVWALAQIPNTIIVFSLAWLIAFLLNPAIDAIQGKRLGPIKKASRGTAVALVTALLLGILMAAGSWIVPQLTEQVQKLIQVQTMISDPMQLPIAIQEKVEPILAKLPDGLRQEAMERASVFIQEGTSKIGTWVTQALGWLGSFLGELLSGVFIVLTAFLVSLYMLMNWHNMGDAFIEKLPRTYQIEIRSLSTKMNQIFGAYLKATILTSIICMIATFISLTVLVWVTGTEFPYKGLVSFVAGITYPVPIIGIIATSILGGVLGFFTSNSLAFGVAVLAVINVINILIDRTVQPKLMSDAIGVSELFVMFAAFAGGEVAGLWGMLLGIPFAAMGKVLFEWFHAHFLIVDEDGKIARRASQGLKIEEEAVATSSEPEPTPEPSPESEPSSSAPSEPAKTPEKPKSKADSDD